MFSVRYTYPSLSHPIRRGAVSTPPLGRSRPRDYLNVADFPEKGVARLTLTF
jgi:hypothetical protein